MASIETITKVFTLANHPDTPVGEKLAAYSRGFDLIEKSGILTQMTRMTDVGNRVAVQRVGTPVTEYEVRIKILENELATVETKCSELTRQNSDLKNRIKAHKATPAATTGDEPVDGFYTFVQFRNAVVAHIDRENGWQTIFCDLCSTNLATLQAWRVKKQVPVEAYERIATIDVSKISQSLAERKPWTTGEQNRLAAILDRNAPPYTEIAKMLSREFGRVITVNAIKGAADRIRQKIKKNKAASKA